MAVVAAAVLALLGCALCAVRCALCAVRCAHDAASCRVMPHRAAPRAQDSMEEQEVKEVLLGYWGLLSAGQKGLSEDALDTKVLGEHGGCECAG